MSHLRVVLVLTLLAIGFPYAVYLGVGTPIGSFFVATHIAAALVFSAIFLSVRELRLPLRWLLVSMSVACTVAIHSYAYASLYAGFAIAVANVACLLSYRWPHVESTFSAIALAMSSAYAATNILAAPSMAIYALLNAPSDSLTLAAQAFSSYDDALAMTGVSILPTLAVLAMIRRRAA